MAIRFRRRIRLAPGFHLNLSGSGVGFTVGPRGAGLSFGSRGTYLNTSITGTGLYQRGRIAPPGVGVGSALTPSASSKQKAHISVADDGSLVFLGDDGQPLSELLVRKAKAQNKDTLLKLMSDAAAEINDNIEALECIYVTTPPPDQHPSYDVQPFSGTAPLEAIPRKHGLLGLLFGSVRERIDRENEAARTKYLSTVADWRQEKFRHEQREHERKQLIEELVLTDVTAMETALENSLQELVWPRETEISSEIREGGRVVMLDVDLPEIEDMPRKSATVPMRGYKLSIKELAPTRVQQLYMRHVHGVGFRIIGEVFYALPKADWVVLSAYSQRADKATGSIQDQYLYSVKVARKSWSLINFKNLSELDVVIAMDQFDMRSDVGKTGVFKPIIPYEGVDE